MALTSLEAIALKLQEKRTTDLENILKVSGSSAISKNEYGVTLVNENDVASSLLFKPLVKSKIDNVELMKAVDVEVKELKPNIPEINRNLVPKPLYDDKVIETEDLRKQVTDLTVQVTDLTSQVTDLQAQVQSETNKRLGIEQSNDVLANQLDALSKVIDQFANQIQSAVQKSVDESILRASLQAQNAGFKAQIEALIKQIDSLNSIIEGLQSQLGAVQQQQAIQQSTSNSALASGGDILVKTTIVKWDGAKDRTDVPKGLAAKLNAKDYNSTKWEAGGQLIITNNDKLPVTISITTKLDQNWNWLTIPKNNFEVVGGGSDTLDFKINAKAIPSGAESRQRKFIFSWGWGPTTEFKGTIKITATKADGTTESKEYPANIVKANPGSY
jgi:predicted  nucleic acid-binding Zn-ribbon protein